MNCEKCGIEHLGTYGSGRFCSSKCARSFSTAHNRLRINEKISFSLSKILPIVDCKICGRDFQKSHRRETCCSKECKNKNKTLHVINKTKEQRALTSAKGSKGKYKRNPESILDLSSRTVGKIISRLNIGCCVCGWNKAPCDIHHIQGRKIPNADDHSNLTYLCPNCHRLFHKKKLSENDVISLRDQIGDHWKEYYYG